MKFFCPTCHIQLQAQQLDGIRLWKCSSCRGFAISIPIVRKELQTQTFKRIWQQLFSGDFKKGRPCPGCKKPLNVVEAEGHGGAVEIDVCRNCHILWFDDKEFAGLPKVVQEIEMVNQSESRLLTPEEITFAAFKKDQLERRSILFKLLDGSISKELELDRYFGDFFD